MKMTFFTCADLQKQLTIFDYSDPLLLVKRGTYIAPDVIQAMQVRNALTYLLPVGNNAPMLEVVDATNPDAPTKIGQLALAGRGISLDAPAGENLVYVGYFDTGSGGGGVQIVDVTDPTTPSVLSTIPTQGKASAVAVENEIAYVSSLTAAEDGWFLEAFDVTDPSNPVSLASISGTGTTLWDVKVIQGTIVATFPEEGVIRTFALESSTNTSKAIRVLDTISPTASSSEISSVRTLDIMELFDTLWILTPRGYYGYGVPQEKSASEGISHISIGRPGPQPHDVSLNVAPGGAVTAGCDAVANPSENVAAGTEVTLTAQNPESCGEQGGWNFQVWTGDFPERPICESA